MWKKLTIFGMLGALAYVLHVVLGGILWHGYNHLQQPISDLTASGAPNRILLGYITNIYGCFSLIFALSAFLYIRRFSPKCAKAGMIIFLMMHVVSLSYGLFPEDLAGAKMTFQGLMHIIVTGLIVPLTILAPLFIGIGFRKVNELKRFSVYSIGTSIFILIAGGTTAFFFANRLPYFGLVERLNIGSLQLWMFLMSLKLLKTDIKTD